MKMTRRRGAVTSLAIDDAARAFKVSRAVGSSPRQNPSLTHASGVAVDGNGGKRIKIYLINRLNRSVIKVEKPNEEHVQIFFEAEDVAAKRGSVETADKVWESTDKNKVPMPRMITTTQTCEMERTNVYVTDSRKCTVIAVDQETGKMSPLAGCGLSGGRDGPVDAASFAGPWGICTAPTGEIFIAEYFGCKIRMIKDGKVTTVAGQGSRGGFRDGPAMSACFAGPRGICFDPVHNSIIIADSGNHVIRLLDLDSMNVSTIAGNGTRGYLDGPAKEALFNEPTAIALDPNDGTIYVADQENRRVRTVDIHGQTSTLAGSGQPLSEDSEDGLSASFKHPTSLFLCSENRTLYVSDTNSVRCVSLGILEGTPNKDDEDGKRKKMPTHAISRDDGEYCVWCTPQLGTPREVTDPSFT